MEPRRLVLKSRAAPGARAALAAPAQSYPARPVSLVVPYPPGAADKWAAVVRKVGLAP